MNDISARVRKRSRKIYRLIFAVFCLYVDYRILGYTPYFELYRPIAQTRSDYKIRITPRFVSVNSVVGERDENIYRKELPAVRVPGQYEIDVSFVLCVVIVGLMIEIGRAHV